MKPKIIRASHADKALGGSAPVLPIDQAVIDSFARLADVKETPYEKPNLETFLRERHRLEPENYSPELLWIIQTLNEYVRIMSRGTNSTPTQHATQVGKLTLCYSRALRSTEAVVLYDTVLWYFSFYEAEAFRAELPFRGMAQYKFGSAENLFFSQHLTTISQMIADIKTRNKLLRELDFHGAIRNIPTMYEKERAGLTTFIDFYTHF